MCAPRPLVRNLPRSREQGRPREGKRHECPAQPSPADEPASAICCCAQKGGNEGGRVFALWVKVPAASQGIRMGTAEGGKIASVGRPRTRRSPSTPHVTVLQERVAG